MHMSNDAIYDILKSPDGEKFTESEAKYAIDHLDNLLIKKNKQLERNN